MIAKIEKRHNNVEITIGVVNSYSTTLKYKDTLTGNTISCGCSGSGEDKVLTADFPLLCISVIITDQDIVNELWAGFFNDDSPARVFKAVMSELTSEQVFDMFQYISNIVFEKGVKKGRSEKLNEILAVLKPD